MSYFCNAVPVIYDVKLSLRVAVRRNIKMMTNEKGRPPDWYSTKNCALQYAKLLECVDTPKRKRERGDGANETPGEIVTKMLSRRKLCFLKLHLKKHWVIYFIQKGGKNGLCSLLV